MKKDVCWKKINDDYFPFSFDPRTVKINLKKTEAPFKEVK
jgi:hypothetical protein